MDSLLQLAERCEAAEGANYALERDIAAAVGHPSATASGFAMQYEGVRLPAYTASLDAAMMLVPEGWIVDLCIRLGMEQHECKLHEWPQPCRKTPLVNAATPALALCAAALRARHSQGVSDNGR